MTFENVKNEQGVIIKLVELLVDTSWEITNAQVEFPDLTLTNIDTGSVISAEVEYMLSNFLTHGHDITQCDLVVCWKNNVKDFPIPVWELSNECNFIVTDINAKDAEIWYLKKQVKSLKQKLAIAKRSFADRTDDILKCVFDGASYRDISIAIGVGSGGNVNRKIHEVLTNNGWKYENNVWVNKDEVSQ